MTKKTPFKLKSGNKPAFKDVGSSPAMQKGKKWKDALKKVGKAAAGALTGGLDAVYGTGKDKSGGVVFSEGNKKPETKTGEDIVKEQTATNETNETNETNDTTNDTTTDTTPDTTTDGTSDGTSKKKKE